MLKCPQCDSYGNFIIDVPTSVVVNKFAIVQKVNEPVVEWDRNSYCECIKCGYASTVGEFNFTDFYYEED